MRIPGFGRLKQAARHTIAWHRRSPAVRMLHDVASFVESSYNNDGSDIRHNGEQHLIKKLGTADFRCAIDVGANNGDWTWEALSAWPSVNVHLFEVAPKTFEALRGRFDTSSFANNVILNQVGISNQSGMEDMHYFPDHPDLTCDLPRHSDYETVTFLANLETLDRYCSKREIEEVDFLKIDVEGAEYKVLQGFLPYLRSQKVQCIQFEYGAFSTQTRVLLKDYYDLLGKYYWIGKVFPSYVEFTEYVWNMEDYQFCNYLCVSRRRMDLRTLVTR